MLKKSKFIWFCKEKEIPKQKKERPKPPLRGRRGAYSPFFSVRLIASEKRATLALVN